MPNFIYANNVKTTLAAAVSASSTVIHLSSTQNAPTSIPAGYVWEVTLNDEATQQNFEILYATSYLGNGQYQVLRGQENTTALSFNTGDWAFGAVTAGMLGQFVQGGQLGGYVLLNPPTQQNGAVNISGSMTAGGTAYVQALSATGGISGQFVVAQGDIVSFQTVVSNLPYSNRAIAGLSFTMVGSANTVGIGPSSGLSAQGITASTLAIAQAGNAKVFAFDINGNLGIMGGFYGQTATLNGALAVGGTATVSGSGTFGGTLSAPLVKQNGLQVIDNITCTDGSVQVAISNGVATLTKAGGSSATLPIGAAVIASGNGGDPAITLPSYGAWHLELTYGICQINNVDYNVTLSVISGVVTSFGSNADGGTSFNSQKVITMFAQCNASGGESIVFGLAVGGAGLANSPSQPWTVRATRTA